jgi:asparagine synthase (glutamine-hydrolysing)
MATMTGEFTWRRPLADIQRPEVLGWDGRIDNREDLRLQLGDLLQGDTSAPALVRAAYERWGVPGLGRVIGDWSVVLRDPAGQRIVLASDFAGVRPLYYCRRAGSIVWADRLETLVQKTGTDALDETFVAAFLQLGACPGRTPFAGVHLVPAGRAICVTAAEADPQTFWTAPLDDVIRYSDERRYDEQFLALFREAVRVRLQTDAPAVAELSGGLDSSSVVCMAKQLVDAGAVPCRTVGSISYVHRGSLDAPFIEEVERHCGIEGVHVSTHEAALISAGDIADAMPAESGPLDRSAAEAARALGAQVFLTGQNGDLATGNWFDDSLQVAGPLRRGQLARTCREALAWSRVVRFPVLWILARAMRAAAGPRFGASALYVGGGEAKPGGGTSMAPGLLARTNTEPAQLFATDWMQAPPERRSHFRALSLLQDLRPLQRPEALRGLDYTHPFAHRPLVEFLMSVPPDVLCRPGEPRRLMRRALGGLWPAKLRARRSKSLFGVPYFEALKPLVSSLLHERQWRVAERGWVDPASLASRLEKLRAGLDCNEPQLRQIILLECWLRNRWPAPALEASARAS